MTPLYRKTKSAPPHFLQFPDQLFYFLGFDLHAHPVYDEPGGDFRYSLELDKIIFLERFPCCREVHYDVRETDNRGELNRAVELHDLGPYAFSGKVLMGDPGILGRYSE